MNADEFVGLVTGVFIGSVIALVAIGIIRDKTDYRKQAIERGYAEYNPKTGSWQWVEKAEKHEASVEKAP